ncbi:hypothetical protein LTR36_006876 [Oleoguttula mirabilis]|uniref:NOL1/NOP2/Sun domain family member 4 n=1 Tax=Oleoguttula mirabilis TaxID=1507867 RepID=A0AAV9JBD5_9PEZI|nr:hypothetical protein LTR36_006876 [Oleoguttula mirabilis]
MTKTTRNTAAAAEESFHKHYSAIWGAERWQDSLYPALAKPTRHAALINRYASPSDFWQAIAEANLDRDDLEQVHLPSLTPPSSGSLNGIICYARKTSPSELSVSTFPPPKPAAFSQLLTHWNLDAASALVAQLLDVRLGESVLDLCAAPGGKSIALAQSMFPAWHAEASSLGIDGDATGTRPQDRSVTSAVLRSNEADARRQKRLVENLQAYLPAQLIKQGSVQCLRVDGTSTIVNALLAPGGYDKVLVDAPCSSERHIIHAHLKASASGNTAPEMANWRTGSSKRLAQTQLSLMMTALKVVRVGGRVVYATCSIDMMENDGVIEKMVAQVEKERKKGAKWSVKLGFGEGTNADGLLEQWAEKTKHGWIVLPDHPGDGKWGPLYFAVVTKTDGT